MIEINNLTTVKIDEEFLKKIAKIVLEGDDKKKSDLSVALVGQGRIRELNKKYRGKNRTTDVLTFGKSLPRTKPKVLVRGQKFPIIPESESELGEVVICLREVKKNAKRFSSTFEKELTQVLIHGILHLLGYDHEKNETDTKKMEKKQRYYLLKIFP